MSFYREIKRGIYKGILKEKELPPYGEVRTINPRPIWVGMRDGTNIKHLMNTERAERWIQEGTDRTVKMYIKKQELDRL
jgi:hypothetical protein